MKSTLFNLGPSRILGVVAVLFLATITLAYIPAQISLSNPDAISAGAFSLFAISLAAIGGAGCLAWAILSIIPERAARILSAALAVFSASGFIVGSVLTPMTVDVGLVDGGTTAVEIGLFLKIADLSVMTALFAFIIIQFDRVQAFFVNAFIAGTFLGLSYSAYAAVSASAAGPISASAKDEQRPFSSDAFYALSKHENVFVILLDSFDAHFLNILLEEDPALRGELEGFTFFPDSAAVSPTTTGAMPAIHSGRMIPVDSTLGEMFEKMIGRESFLTKTAARADVVLLNPIRNLCPDLVGCAFNQDLIASERNLLTSQWSVLSAIARFRIAPYILKPALYNAERWYAVLSPQQTTDANVLPLFADNMTVSDARPQVRFLHLMHTHTPYNRDYDCNEIEPDNKSHRIAMNNMRCAMRGVVSFLSALRAHDIYDQSLILIVADHGAVSLDATALPTVTANEMRIDKDGRFLLRYTAPHPEKRYAALPKSSNPLFLVKPPDARGVLDIDADRAVSLIDVSATVCAHTALCASSEGFNAFNAPTADERTRVFYDYDMRPFQHTFQTGEKVATEVNPVDFNFSLIAAPVRESVKLYKSLKFSSAEIFAGMSFPERWGRWNNSDEMAFSLCFDKRPNNKKILSITARAYLPRPGAKQRVSIYVNDVLELRETYQYGDINPENVLQWRIDLGPARLDTENCAAIRFSLPDAVPAPATWRDAGRRRIAIGLIEMSLEEQDVERAN